MIVGLGRVPLAAEVAAARGVAVGEVKAGWRRLHDGHALVLGPSGEIVMANPFSAVPTAFRVEAAGRSWFANCAWDAFGIGIVLGASSTIETACPDCREPLRIEVHDNRPDDVRPVFHVLVPAASWWADIGFT
jgi:hypothetical protein